MSSNHCFSSVSCSQQQCLLYHYISWAMNQPQSGWAGTIPPKMHFKGIFHQALVNLAMRQPQICVTILQSGKSDLFSGSATRFLCTSGELLSIPMCKIATVKTAMQIYPKNSMQYAKSLKDLPMHCLS